MDIFWTETTTKCDCFIFGGSEVFATMELERVGNFVRFWLTLLLRNLAFGGADIGC